VFVSTTGGFTVFVNGLQPISQKVITGSGVTQQDKDDIEDQIFARLVESGYTFEQLMRIIAAVAAGNINQNGAGVYQIRDINDTKDRIAGDDTANGGRDITAVDAT
jgi:hypothetical protein